MTALLQKAAAHYRRGEFRQAEKLYDQLIADEPGNAEAWHMRGVIALQCNEPARAVELLAQATALSPGDYAAHVNLAAALRYEHRFQDAVVTAEKALSLNSESAEAYLQQGYALAALGQFENALASFTRAVDLRPDWPEALEGLSNTAYQRGDLDRALDAARRALALDPMRAVAHRLAADVYSRRQEHDPALEHYRASLAMDPEDPAALSRFGMLLGRRGELDEAAQVYVKALAKMPSDNATRHGYGQTLLGLGRLAEGWPLFAARHALIGEPLAKRAETVAPLLAQPARNMRVLAWTDQGVGEEIMFASLIPDLVKTGVTLSVECSDRLVPLFRRSFPDVDVIARTYSMTPTFAQPFDAQISLADTAKWFRPDFEAFPAHRGYLRADADATIALAEKYRAGRPNRPLIGISWRTSKERQGKVHAHKSIGLPDWGPVLCIPGATFVSLQYGDYRGEIAEAERAFGIKIISDPGIDPLKDLDAFAAQVAAMDMVVTTSNATAHMAGALNVPAAVFIAKGLGGMWYWLQNRADNPWYPSLHLLRQANSGDWMPPMDRASEMLVDFVSQWTPAKKTNT